MKLLNRRHSLSTVLSVLHLRGRYGPVTMIRTETIAPLGWHSTERARPLARQARSDGAGEAGCGGLAAADDAHHGSAAGPAGRGARRRRCPNGRPSPRDGTSREKAFERPGSVGGGHDAPPPPLWRQPVAAGGATRGRGGASQNREGDGGGGEEGGGQTPPPPTCGGERRQPRLPVTAQPRAAAAANDSSSANDGARRRAGPLLALPLGAPPAVAARGAADPPLPRRGAARWVAPSRGGAEQRGSERLAHGRRPHHPRAADAAAAWPLPPRAAEARLRGSRVPPSPPRDRHPREVGGPSAGSHALLATGGHPGLCWWGGLWHAAGGGRGPTCRGGRGPPAPPASRQGSRGTLATQ